MYRHLFHGPKPPFLEKWCRHTSVFHICDIQRIAILKILIDWLVFNANFSNISAISWHLKRTQFFKNKHWNIFVGPWGQAITNDINTLQTTLHYRQDKQIWYSFFFAGRKLLQSMKMIKLMKIINTMFFSFFKYIQFCWK